MKINNSTVAFTIVKPKEDVSFSQLISQDHLGQLVIIKIVKQLNLELSIITQCIDPMFLYQLLFYK